MNQPTGGAPHAPFSPQPVQSSATSPGVAGGAPFTAEQQQQRQPMKATSFVKEVVRALVDQNKEPEVTAALKAIVAALQKRRTEGTLNQLDIPKVRQLPRQGAVAPINRHPL